MANYKTATDNQTSSFRLRLLVLAVAFILAALVLGWHSSKGAAIAKVQAAAAATTASTAAPTAPAAPADQVKFDFYTMLPKLKPAPPPADVVEKPKSGDFVDQIAIFGNEDLASNLVEALQLKGFNPQIINIASSDGTTKYRVILGPFGTKEAAQAAAGNLKLAQVDSVVKQEA